MTVRSFPFAGQDSAEDDYYRLHRDSGVLSGLNLTLSGLTWSLSTGEARVGGSMMLVEDAPATGASTATASGATNPRRDMLVARRTLLPDGGSDTVLALIQGAPAVTPTDPTPLQETVGVFEEPLFSWQVPGNGGTALTGIRDRRRLLRADGAAHWLHGVELHSTISTAVGSGVVSGLAFPSAAVAYDSGGYFTGPDSLNILTIPAGRGGLYLVTHRVQLSSVVPGRFFADANTVAGGNKVSRANGTGDDIAQSSRQMRLAVGDVFKLDAFHTAGSTLNVVSRSLSLHLIGT